MSSPWTLGVESDPTLLGDIRRYGKFDTSGCYQCGSCTLSCELVTDGASFPRRVLRYALLGLRRPLLANLDPWVCHDCGDCSIACPRQTEPRISMMTLRRFLSAQYDWTGISRKTLASRAWYLGSLALVGILNVLLILFYHLWRVGLGLRDLATPMGLEHTFPIMTYYTRVVMLFPLLLLFSRVFRIWRLTMRADGQTHVPFSMYVAEAWTYVYHSVTHSLMRKCPERGRWAGHWLLAFGVSLMLAIKTFALRWFQTDNIYPWYHPQRWLGYLAAGLILYGLSNIFIGHVRANKEFYRQTRLEDMVFPVLLLLTALTGISVHILRYAGLAMASHCVYAAHVMIATPMLVVEMSFGKWSHMIYRPLALYFQAVKCRAAGEVPAQEALDYAR